MEEVVLEKGVIVYVQGMPFELLAPTYVKGNASNLQIVKELEKIDKNNDKKTEQMRT